MGESKLPEGYKILRITLGPKQYMKKVVNQLRRIQVMKFQINLTLNVKCVLSKF